MTRLRDMLGRGVEAAIRLGRGGRLAALVLLIGLVWLRAIDPSVVTMARYQAIDLFQRLAPRPPVESRVAIVDVDEASIRALGQWPWSRDRLAGMVDRLTEAGVASIGFDIVFSEPDRLAPKAFADQASGLPPMVHGILSGLESTDDAFAAAIARGPVALGMSGAVTAESAAPSVPRALSPMAAFGGDPRPYLFGFPSGLRNIPELEQAASGIGMFSLAPEHDGVVRRVPAALNIDGALLPTLTLEMLRVAAGASTSAVVMRPDGAGAAGVRIGERFAPTDVNGRAWIRFAPHDPSLYISAADVIAGRVDPARLAGKHVLVGASAVGLRDLRMTPLEQSMPGVEVHAQLIDAILTDGLLHRPAETVGAEHLAAILIAALLIWRLPRLSALGGAPLAFGAVAAVWAGSYAAFAYGSTALDPTYPSLVAIAVYGVLAYSAYARAEAQRRAIRSAFTQYLSPDMVSRLAEDPDALKLGGESREMTFLFCDIAGFTSFVERAEPEALVRLLNEYLEGVCGIVMRSGGTVDKIVGDAVHAMYNAPLDDPDHAANAVRAALEIEAFVDDFRARKAAEGIDFGRTRVGVNTGPAIVGNFGGDSRFDYTAHGDAINTAARLESVNKHLGTTICVAGSTAALCPDLAFRPIGTLYLKGKDKGVETFTPLRPEAAEDPVMIAYARVFERMAENAPRDETLSAFDALAEQSPSDPLIALHAQRLRAGGVGPDIRMTEK